MSYRSRELEVKLVASDACLEEIHEILGKQPGIRRMVFGTSTDTYWTLPAWMRGDFIRMRELDNGITQITVKGKDKGTNDDRIELEIDTDSSRSTTRSLLTAAHGKAVGKIEKTYYVLWMAEENEHTTVSYYYIAGHVEDGVYIELESSSMSTVLELETKVIGILSRRDIHVERAQGSLYELYIV